MTEKATGKDHDAATAPTTIAPDAVPASKPMFQPALASGIRLGPAAANAATSVRFCSAP